MTDLLRCCQRADLDGTSPVDHYRACDARAEDPQDEVLFDLTHLQDGRRPAVSSTSRADHPSHPVIDVWAALRDQDIPEEVGRRLLERQRAVQTGEQPEPCPEADKPFLARHIVSEAGEAR